MVEQVPTKNTPSSSGGGIGGVCVRSAFLQSPPLRARMLAGGDDPYVAVVTGENTYPPSGSSRIGRTSSRRAGRPGARRIPIHSFLPLSMTSRSLVTHTWSYPIRDCHSERDLHCSDYSTCELDGSGQRQVSVISVLHPP